MRLEDELLAPLSDDTLLEHLQQIEKKLQRIAAAYFDEEVAAVQELNVAAGWQQH